MTDDPAAEIKANLERAVAAHVAQTDGAFVTDWVLMAAGVNPLEPDGTQYFVVDSDCTPHARLGLIRLLALNEELPSLGDDD